MEDMPCVVPDDDNYTSYDTSVELSFFESSPFIPRAHNSSPSVFRSTPESEPVQPLALKRRQEGNFVANSYPRQSALRTVSETAIPKRHGPPPPPRASLTPRSPSILSRSSSSRFFASQNSNPPCESSGPSQEVVYNIVPLAQSGYVPRRIVRDAAPFPLEPTANLSLRSVSAPPSELSPSDSPLGLNNHFVEDVRHLGFSAASISSPSDSDSGLSPYGINYYASDTWDDNPPPMTPSRAGAKALQVLGSHTTPGKSAKKNASKPRKDCYRPLPTTVFQEIDLFFGFPNAKATKQSASSKQSHNRVIETDTSEQEEFSGLLSDHKATQQDLNLNLDANVASTYRPLLPPIRLHSKASMDALRRQREPDSPIFESGSRGACQEDEEDVFGTLESLSTAAHGIHLANNKIKERIVFNRQHSHPPPSVMGFLQNDPYTGTQRRHTSADGESGTLKRKEPPPPLTLRYRSPSALKQVIVEQVVSGRPRLPSLQVPPRTSSRNRAPLPFGTQYPHTPFMAPRPAPAPPGAPLGPRRLVYNSESNSDTSNCPASSPKTPRTPSPEQMQAAPLLTRIPSHPDDQSEQRPLLVKGMSFFDDSPSPDHTHFRFAPSKATMRAVSGRIRKAVRV